MNVKSLLAFLVEAAAAPYCAAVTAPPPVRLCKQHPSIKRGKSGVAAARRAAKGRRKAK